MTRALALFACVLATGCIRQLPASYTCTRSSQCVFDGVEGTCEASGVCSFPDGSCASGRRYGDLDPPGLAGSCVIVDTDSGAVIPPDLAGGGDLGSTPPIAISRVGSSKVAPAAVNNAVILIALPAGVTAGDLLLASVYANDPNSTIAAPAGWTRLGTASGGNYAASWFWRVATVAQPNTTGFAVTNAPSMGAAVLVAYRNVSSTPIDAAISRPFSGAPYVVPSLTTTHAGDMLVAMFVDTTQGASLGTPMGMTSAVDDGVLYVYDEAEPTAGATGTRSAGSLPGVGAVEAIALSPAP